MSTPRAAAAASTRLLIGVRKMIWLLAGTVSQLLSAISCSSYPADQPA
jgi:hypothetical protein